MSKYQKLFITSVQITSTGGSSSSHIPFIYTDVRNVETKDSVTGKIYRTMLEKYPNQRICIAPIEVYECLNPVNVTGVSE